MEPYRINVSEDDLTALRGRIRSTRWPAPGAHVAPGRGVDLTFLQDMARYWVDVYDWRAAERRLNAVPNFVDEIQGSQIHFQHVRSSHPDAMPLLLTHGWPGSVAEFERLVPYLTEPTSYGGHAEDAFHVVVPSLPGFGFSATGDSGGWDVPKIAAAWSELMGRLGYDRYVAHGGDAGSPITQVLSMIDPQHVAGIHLTMLMTFPTPDEDLSEFDRLDRDRLAALEEFGTRRSAYMQVMATRPLTLSYGLSDSPVGLLAWMLERYLEWADPDSVQDGALSWDDILTAASLYWFTNTAATSANFYYEGAPAMRELTRGNVPAPNPAPAAVSVFPHDIMLPIPALASRYLGNIVQWRDHTRGGHFPALECPEALATDLRSFARDLRKAPHMVAS
ncbi:epoxide hydrolase family protein [Myceligenerans xiligouense]|uniref:Pimeloyl-ACP methyl ester carboxylesterase n=1 Tax=Myceligenerans xiligouense TaxID=253184 RepID=A0A3N4YIS5_9MICO|nr:epoxide hydrolase [Myceligenerans xiligouense]RPF20007.1 pimeloyl-ACP methyl ester carboxylesterase [Myceligenerans xiligouense]